MVNERHERIMEILKEKGKVSVEDLAKALFVCEMTIRRDLSKLAIDGRVKRYKGGAMLFVKETEFSFADRRTLESSDKMRLAKMASRYVEDSSVVFIDSSSTCAYVVPHLSLKKHIKIVTNSMTVVALAAQYDIPCMLVGGECYSKDMCTVGSFAIEMLDRINVDVAFFSANAISADGLITDRNSEQTAVRRTAMKQAARSIYIFTKSKQNKTEMFTVCRAEEVFKVIRE